VGRQLCDLRLVQDLERIVGDLELGFSSFLSDGEELVQGHLVANDVGFLFPGRLGKQGSNKVANVEAVGEHYRNIAGTWNSSGFVGNVDGQGWTS